MDEPQTVSHDCEICGEHHFYENCGYVKITNHVPDSKVPPKARLSLPTCFEVKKLADETYSIFAKEGIKKGTQFGPLKARKQFTLDPFIKFPIKLFSKSDLDITEYYLDTSNENECNWMMFVNAASFAEEQNLICYQVNEDIYFGSICDINPGDCLKVWYSPFYAIKMNKQVLSSNRPNIMETEPQSQDVDVNELVIKQQNILPREIWNCKFCYALEKDIVKFAEHLIVHYRRFLRNICEKCNAQFLYKRSLKKHINSVHNKQTYPNVGNILNLGTKISEPPDNKRVTEPNDTLLGGPLLMNMISDSFDNSSCILQQPELSNFDIENQNILPETDNLLSVDVLNEKNIENITFQVNDSGQQICDLCMKSFNSIKSLMRHLEQHTGKYICQQCSKVFSRKESLLGHRCITYPQVKCLYCPKTFSTKKLFVKHVRAIHNKEHCCTKCKKTFWDNYYLLNHNCVSVSEQEKKKFKCQICSRELVTLKYLREHQRTHKEQVTSTFICHICSKSLNNKRSYVQHLRLHEEPSLSCDLCDKKFYQSDSLMKHKQTVHTKEELQTCDICSLHFKTKISLVKHKIIHSNKTFHCNLCNEEFRSNSNLSRHMRRVHSSKKLEGRFVCPFCQKEMKLKSSYLRHLRKFHPKDCDSILSKENENLKRATADDLHEDFDLDKSIDTDQKCRDLKETIDNMNFTVDLNACNGNMDGSETIDRFLKETTKEINIPDITRDDRFFKENNTKITGMSETNNVPADREVQLSVPDLSQTNTEIKLGSNAYILENGTIVEPQENPSNVVVYILNESSVPLKDLVDDIL